ncbi:Wzz/FepE/Etk N-terminal domain-containing protein [Amnibacterium kyonggiense]
MTFLEFVRLLRRGLVLVILVTVLGALGGLVLARLQPPSYQASATLLVTAIPQDSAANGQAANLFAQSRAQLLSSLITTDAVLSRARSTLGSRASLDDLRQSVSASSVENTNFTVLSASAPSADQAVEIVAAVANAAQSVGGALDSVAGRNGSTQDIRITQVTPPDRPSRAFSPQPRNYVAAGGALGLAAAILLLLIRDVASRRIRGADDVNELGLGFPVAVIEHSSPLSLRRQRKASIESYRYLRSTLIRALGSRGLIAVTSVSPSSSVSSLGFELAHAIQEVGLSVLVVDARLDLQHRDNPKRRGAGADEQVPPGVRARAGSHDIPTTGDASARTERLSTVRFEEFSPETGALVAERGWQALADSSLTEQLRSASNGFDHVVLLLPSLADSAESAVSAANTDAVVLQMDASVTKQGEVLLATERLRASGVKEIVGAVVGAAPMDVLPSSKRSA